LQNSFGQAQSNDNSRADAGLEKAYHRRITPDNFAVTDFLRQGFQIVIPLVENIYIALQSLRHNSIVPTTAGYGKALDVQATSFPEF